MNVSEQTMNRGIKNVVESQKKNACVMLNDQGQEVHITKAMVVSACQQLLRQCRSIKN
ncbi:PA1571 family protein [Acinetobacter sp. TGL-Y2]|uniref:PA1571 family protein n=1 Tax=Acinetobacter sp. TGL-Y2 TaxID=1407071 RepID=UPI000AC3D100|nr:PA1571 family protein [Acinetobacter sp. TGL-Y2]